MSDIPVEKKMEIVHQIRSQYQKNQYDLINRENLLYGRTSSQIPRDNDYYKQYNMKSNIETEESIFKDGTVKIRYALAAVLLLTIILLDRSDKNFAGVEIEQIFKIIETDYGYIIETWMNGNS